MRKFIFCTALVFFTAVSLTAQTKSETKLYDKTIAKPSVKACDKFLSKYPESVYSLEITTIRDTKLFDELDKDNALAVENFAAKHKGSPIYDLINAIVIKHNTTDLSITDAMDITKGLGIDARSAVPYRKTGVDHIVTVNIKDGIINIFSCDKKLGVWSISSSMDFEIYTNNEVLSDTRLISDASIVTIGGNRYLEFSYLNSNKDSMEQEYVGSLLNLSNNEMSNAMFYGRNMLASVSDKDYKIEGQSPEALSGGVSSAETVFLLNSFSDNTRLVQISKANALTDDAIVWWLSKNPNAETNASKITFGTLDPESSLIDGFKNTRSSDKDSSKNYTAALFDMRGYTVIVVYSKTQKDYVLAWCEPVCKNRNKDKLLNTIYFENDNTVSMFYYKGKTSFKYHLNIATKAIKR